MNSGRDRMQECIDRQEISDLLFEFAQAMDDRDWDKFEACFAPGFRAIYSEPPPVGDAILDSGAALTDFARRGLAHIDATQHLVGNIRITLDGDTAEVTAYVHAQHRIDGAPGGDNMTISGTYNDRVVRREGAWKFASRQMIWSSAEGNLALFDHAQDLAEQAGS